MFLPLLSLFFFFFLLTEVGFILLFVTANSKVKNTVVVARFSKGYMRWINRESHRRNKLKKEIQKNVVETRRVGRSPQLGNRRGGGGDEVNDGQQTTAVNFPWFKDEFVFFLSRYLFLLLQWQHLTPFCFGVAFFFFLFYQCHTWKEIAENNSFFVRTRISTRLA